MVYGESKKDVRPLVPVLRFNTVLNDTARQHYRPITDILFAVMPEMMERKIPAANVQQSFMLAAVLAMTPQLPAARMLCVGSYEDTAYETLLRMGYCVEGLDPNVDGRDLDAYIKENPSALGTFDTVFSTSVIEHVPNDNAFVQDISRLLRPGGCAVLTCDYRNAWQPGEPLPPTDERFYRLSDLRERLVGQMQSVEFVDEPDWERHEPDFEYGGCHYSFASFVVRKKIV
jgi:SAM-dependent methyltransferase